MMPLGRFTPKNLVMLRRDSDWTDCKAAARITKKFVEKYAENDFASFEEVEDAVCRFVEDNRPYSEDDLHECFSWGCAESYEEAISMLKLQVTENVMPEEFID